MLTRLLCLVLALTFIAPTQAAINSLSVTSLSPGELLVINGIDFGTKHAKVRLLPIGGSGKGKTTLLKLLTISDTSITAQFKKALPGEYMLEVTPKGGPTFTASEAVLVRLPEVIIVEPSHALPGDEIELLGRYFGDKKGKVKVGGKKAKVLSWERDVLNGPGAITDRIRVLLSKNAKKMHNGLNALELRNRIGSVVSDVGVHITGGGLHTYRAMLDDDAWAADNKFGFPGYNVNGVGGISTTGFKGKPNSKKARSLAFAIHGFDPLTFVGDLPYTVGGTNVVALVNKGVGPSASIWQSDLGLPLSGDGLNPIITITEINDGTITGFGQALGLVGINGNAIGTTLDVTEFEFTIPMLPEEL